MNRHQGPVALLISLMVSGLTACQTSSVTDVTSASESTAPSTAAAYETTSSSESTPAQASPISSNLFLIDMDAWNYQADADVFWQTGISYCATPADTTYETLGIFIPAAYMNAQKNADGTYTCTINDSGEAGGYTASTAPILFPVNTPGHKAQDAPGSFLQNCSSYTDAGFIYVLAGCRGKDAGVPAGVADLKSAIRYIRYNEEILPGSTDRIVVYGHSGGGSQSAVLGASGDSPLYTPYLEALGAADTSDAVAAAMCWCPITGFDSADPGYEWNMGATRTGLSEEMQSYSDALALAYADYVNRMGFVSSTGQVLTLEASEEGMAQAGSYYDYVKDVIETSLEHYLTDTAFPTSQKSGSYASAGDYITSLNSDEEWVSYDAQTGQVTISSIAAFSRHCKKATKPIAAFDKLEEGGHELFNTGDGEKTHFDPVLYEIIQDSSYAGDFASDLARTDALGNSIAYRLNMFSPLYYLLEANEGYRSSQAATYWRIRTGIEQSDTALTTEINLALALESYGAKVDFETVWGQGHTQAERTGKGEANFIEWVNSIWS